MQIQLSTAREINRFIEGSDLRETLENMRDNEADFTVGSYLEYRFIHQGYIRQIMMDELESDLYVLGCFNAWFLADVLDVDCDVIEAMQKAEAYEAIGKLVVSQGKLGELQQKYAAADGYGHHFAHYDGNEHEFGDYLAFRV